MASSSESGTGFRWPETWPKPPRLSHPGRTVLIVIAAVLGFILLVWLVLNLLLSNVRTGTPMVNWALGAFGDANARVATGKLAHPFSNRFELRRLDWPGRVEAEDIELTYDLFGFLPGRPWASKLSVRDGEVMLENRKEDRTTLNPQSLVDAVEVQNLDLKFSRKGKLREATIIKASGSFSSGTVSGEAVSGRNRIIFDDLRRSWDGGLRGAVTARGENLKELAEILGASAPDTPPFDVNGDLRMRRRTWSVEGLTGRLGDSDISGAVSIDLKPEKPFLTVDLTSQRLDFDDLGVVFGIPVGVGQGETSNKEQRDARAVFARSSRLIPNARIDFSRLGAVNGDFALKADTVVDAPMGVSRMALSGELRDQQLAFDRVVLKTSTGDIEAKALIDARKDPAVTRMSGTLENLAIRRIVDTPFVRGTLSGAFQLTLTGSGFREAFGAATGEAGVWSNNSEVAKIATEAAGLDLGEILLILAEEDEDEREYLKSRCLAVNIAFADGRAALAPAVLDNEDSLIVAQGHSNLKTEELDLEVRAHPHDVSFGKIFGDIRVAGTLRDPKVSALNEETVLQAGVSALLSSIAGPLAALPFVELGGNPDAPCTQLLADSRNAGQAQDPTLRSRQKDRS